MMSVRNVTPCVTLGYAADPSGDGVVYGSLREPGGATSLVRVGFRCRPLPALAGRDVAYAALQAIAAELLVRERRSAEFRLDAGALAADLRDRGPIPSALTLAYVRLRCTLNRFREANVVGVADRTTRDLTARARAEANLSTAA